MSAYVVSKQDVSIIVAATIAVAEQTDPTIVDRATPMGQALLDECVASVSHRYPDDDLGELPGHYAEETVCEGITPIDVAEWLTPYEYVAPAEPVTRELVSETVGSYEYQSCEHPGWEDSWSRKLCATLRALSDRIPPTLQTEPVAPDVDYGDLSREETIKRIRAALKRRSGKAWSVTGGRGTAWGWIEISAPPKRRTGAHVPDSDTPRDEYGRANWKHVDTGEPQEFGLMTPADCAELGELLGLDRPVHCQGQSVASSRDHYREYIDRAEGRVPSAVAAPYWD